MNAFEKIIGYSSEKREFMQIADTLKNRAYYDKLGVLPPMGLLLHGVPGVGKTRKKSDSSEKTASSVPQCCKYMIPGDLLPQKEEDANER